MAFTKNEWFALCEHNYGFHRDINSSSCRHNFEKDIVLEKFETTSPKQNGKP